MGVGADPGLKPQALACHPRKELKDPDQLYTTLKNLLAQIKVGNQAPLFWGIPMLSGLGAVVGRVREVPVPSSALPSSPTPVPGPSWSP